MSRSYSMQNLKNQNINYLVEYVCVIDGFYENRRKSQGIKCPAKDLKIKESPSELEALGNLDLNRSCSPNMVPSTSYSSNLLSPSTNFYRYPKEDQESYPLPVSIIDFMRPESCSAFHWNIEDNRHKICDICKISGEGVPRENCFILTLTDKDINQTRYAIVETIAASKYEGNVSQMGEDMEKSFRSCGSSSNSNNSRPVTFAIISPHPFYNKYKEILQFLKAQYFRDFKFFETCVGNLLKMPQPNFNGKNLVTLLLSESESSLCPQQICFQYTDKTKLPYLDVNCSLPLALLGPDNFVKVIIMLILEYKIVIISRNLSALTQSIETFVALLYPLEFMFCVIPLLPQQLQGSTNILTAPTPYIIGVTHSLVNSVKIPGDVYMVDLDANTICCRDVEDKSRNSQSGQSNSVTSTDSNNASATKRKESITQQFQATSDSIPMPAQHCLDEFIDQVENNNSKNRNNLDKVIRIASTKLICSILAGVNAHTRILRLYPRSLISVNTRTWLCSIKRDRIRNEALRFFSDLIKTHAVEYFAEKSLDPDNVAFIRIELGETDVGALCKQYDYDEVVQLHIASGEITNLDTVDISSDIFSEDGSVAASHGNKSRKSSIISNVSKGSKSQDLVEEENTPLQGCRGKKRMTEEEIKSMVVVSVSSLTSPGAIQANSLFRQLSDERFLRKPRNLEALENQNYLKDVITQVLNGDMMTWFSGKTLANLLVDESYRLYILSNLDAQTQGNFNDEYLEHIEIDKQVYNNMLIILRICLSGLARVFDSGRAITAGSNGLSSAIMLFEIAMTHYYVPGSENDNKKMGENLEKIEEQQNESPSFTDNANQNLAQLKTLGTNLFRNYFGSSTESSPEEENPKPSPSKEPKKIDIKKIKNQQNVDSKGIDRTKRSRSGSRSTTPNESQLPPRPTSICSENQERTPHSSGTSGSSKGSIKKTFDIRYRSNGLKKVLLSPTTEAMQTVPNKRVYLYQGLILNWKQQLEKKINEATSQKFSQASNLFSNFTTRGFNKEKVKSSDNKNGTMIINSGSASTLSSSGSTSGFSRNTSINDDHQKNAESNLLPLQTDISLLLNFDFWEECWLDNVQQERAARGMEPSSFADLQEHYKNLTIEEKTKLEKDEDELLAVSLYNLTCICLTLRVPPNLVRTRIRRMLAKAHLSLKSSKELSTLLDNIMDLTRIKRFREPGPSMLDLKPSLGVRHRRQQAFIAYFGKADDEKSPIVILEICQSAMIIRSGTTGVIR